VLPDPTSAVVTYNRFTNQPEMRYGIEIWKDKVQKEVAKYLNKIVGQETQPDNIRVLPFDKVILTNAIPMENYFLFRYFPCGYNL
jgi:hypothetical protein